MKMVLLTVGMLLASGWGVFAQEVLNERDLRKAGIAWLGVADLPIRCPFQGVGHTPTLSRDLFDHYRNRGFSLRSLCLALGSYDVRYDPSTGHRLNRYQLAGMEDLEQGDIEFYRFPLHVPDCFRTVEVLEDKGATVVWRPTGCVVRYHPKTGASVRNASAVRLHTGGAAGEAPGPLGSTVSSTVGEGRLRRMLRGE
jgi:hypothetical protein